MPQDYTHPITPPPELVQQWFDAAVKNEGKSSRDWPVRVQLWFDAAVKNEGKSSQGWPVRLAAYAAQWGADQELLAAGNYLKHGAAWEEEDIIEFYNYRRPQPKPPSLKEQALDELNSSFDKGYLKKEAAVTIRRALEQLDD